MIDLLKKLKTASDNRTTYRVGLLQARAYRVLKHHTREALKKFDISTIEWALLGLLFESKDGLRSSLAALELGVEASFVTELSKSLTKKGLITIIKDQDDKRGRLLVLTEKGVVFVRDTESYLTREMRPLLTGIKISDLLSYIVVIEKIGMHGKQLKGKILC